MLNKNEPRRKVLIVDDDCRLSNLLQRYLQAQGFSVKAAKDGERMDTLLLRDFFDLIVLDLMLPGEDGLSICQRLRSQYPKTGVIMLTGKGDEVDRIIGLELGADDYLPKPCNPRELTARIKSVLRRLQRDTPGAPTVTESLFNIGACELNLQTRILHQPTGNTRLTSGEFGLLKVLVENAGRPMSRDQLMTLGRGRDHQAFDRSIDVQISRLRKMIEPDPSTPRYLQTVWGHGYILIPEGKLG